MYVDRPTTFPLEGEADLLQRGPALRTMLNILRGVQPPSCVALYGSWGVGKTSMLKSAYMNWQDGPRVWFDPWEYERQDNVLSPLLLRIARAKGSEDVSERAKALCMGVLRVLSRVAVKASSKTLGLEIEAEDLSVEGLKKLFAPAAQFHDEIAEAKQRFAELIAEINGTPDRRTAIFLDDLDRCLPETVVSLIEAVKLFLCDRDSPANVVFVFAVDRRVVGEAIRHRYGGVSTYTGENYLEKIFDVSLEVPDLRAPAVERFLESLGLKTTAPITAELRAILSAPCFTNPRVIKRVLSKLDQVLTNPKASAIIAAMKPLDLHSFLVWLAGAERFRLFRMFMLDAPPRELMLLRACVVGATGNVDYPRDVPPHLQQLATLPEFGDYYSMLSLEDASSLADQMKVRKILREHDAIIRALGL